MTKQNPTIYGLEIDPILKADYERRRAEIKSYDYHFETPFIIKLPKDLKVIGQPEVVLDFKNNQMRFNFKLNKDLRFIEDDND